MSLKKLQYAFKKAATSQGTQEFLETYLPYDKEEAQGRFAIYQNNVMANLAGVLVNTFPACEKLVGEDFFRQRAYKFIEKNLPQHAALFLYGADFISYFDTLGQENNYAYWGEVSAYEWAWHCCYYGTDAQTLSLQDLATFNEETFGNLIVQLAPAVHLLKTTYNIQDIINVVKEPSIEKNDQFEVNKTHDHYLFYPTKKTVDVVKVDPCAFKALEALKTSSCSFETLTNLFQEQKDETLFASFITLLFEKEILIL